MKRFTQTLIVGLVLLVAIGCGSRRERARETKAQTGPDLSGKPIAVQETIPFAETADIRNAVKQQCQLQTKTPRFVEEFGRREGLEIKLVDDLNQTDIDRKLHITITEAHAPAGGGFSGLKWMIVEAELHDGNKKIATVKSRRNTSGGYFAAYKGTCDIIGRSTKAIGQDLARWLTDPRDGAMLGDL